MALQYSTGKYLQTDGVGFEQRRDFFIKPDQYAELYPEITPLTTTVYKQAETITNLKDPVFKLFEHRFPIEKSFTIATGGNVPAGNQGNVATLIIDANTVKGMSASVDGSWEGFVIEIWNNLLTLKRGHALVLGYTNTTTMQVRSLDTTGFTVANGDKAFVVGTAFPEGSTAPESWSDELKVVWGSTQIFKTSVEVTNTLLTASLRGAKNEMQRLQAMKAKEHKMLVEAAFWFGKSLIGTNMKPGAPGEYDSDSGPQDVSNKSLGTMKPIRTMTGLYTAIETYGTNNPSSDKQNIFDFQYANFSWGQFVDMCQKIAEKNLNTLDGQTWFCGPTALAFWSKLEQMSGIAKNSGWAIKLYNQEKSPLGFNIRKLETPFGVVNLALVYLFKDRYTNHIVIPNMKYITRMVYRPTVFKSDIKKDDGYDATKHMWMSDEGLAFNLIETHNLIRFS